MTGGTVEPTPSLVALDILQIGVPVVVTTSGGVPVVVVRTGPGAVGAFSGRCPHRGCTVELLAGDLVCPCHNSRFVPTTGARIRGAAPTSLPTVAVTVADGEVYLA